MKTRHECIAFGPTGRVSRSRLLPRDLESGRSDQQHQALGKKGRNEQRNTED
jgi:hypothetical protein